MNFIAATLLMHLQQEEAFWMFVCLIKTYKLRNYFAAGVPELVINLYCLDRLIELHLPQVFSHFKEQRVTPILFASEWFTTLFGYTFELSFTRIIWTVFFHEGKPWLFRVALAIVSCLEKQILQSSFESLIMLLKNPPVNIKQVVKETGHFTSVTKRVLEILAIEAAQHTDAEALM